MMSDVDIRLIALLKQLVAWLVNGDFAAAEARCEGVRLSADAMKKAIEEYGRRLVMPPEESFANPDAVRVTNADRPTWSVRVDLWTKEEGRSDLSVECTICERDDQSLDLEIDDIHVL
jgi:hypothetical protein